MIKLYNKYQKQINYLIFGVLTTIVNIAVYYLCSKLIGSYVLINTSIAWIVSVLFAYFTNRKWVFKSTSNNAKETFNEFVRFITSRLATGALDLLIMYTFVNVLNFNDLLIKILSNIIVVVSNYILSKVIVFK